MILSGKEIVRHMGEEIIINPFHENQVNPNSYNLTLADELMIYENHELDMKKENKEQFNLHKGQLIHGRFSGRRMAAHRKICHEEGRREK